MVKQQDKQRAGTAQPAPAQAAAIEHAFGPIQVLAGPGSGKTYLTIRRIRHLICHHGISPNKILVITFTKAAALEMEERFYKLTDRQYEGVSFGTFHAVYFHILKKSGYGGGRLNLATVQEKRNCLNHVLGMHGIKDADREVLGMLLKEISRWKNGNPVRAEDTKEGNAEGGIGGKGNAGKTDGKERTWDILAPERGKQTGGFQKAERRVKLEASREMGRNEGSEASREMERNEEPEASREMKRNEEPEASRKMERNEEPEASREMKRNKESEAFREAEKNRKLKGFQKAEKYVKLGAFPETERSVKPEEFREKKEIIKPKGVWKAAEKDRGLQAALSAGNSSMEEERLQQIFPIIFKEYCGLMEEMGKLDFDDMIFLCDRMFAERREIREYWQHAFSHILVDEFQDISPLQYRVLKQLAAPEDNLFVVGDDDQSIYGFRGAGPDIMRQFMEDYPNALQLTLDTNYRSAGHIVQSSLQLIANNHNRFAKQIRANQEENGQVVLRAFQEKEEEEKHLIGLLKNMSRDDQEHTAIICRTNVQLAGFSRPLARENIPFCCKEQIDNLFSHETAKDLLAYLRFAHDTYCDAGHDPKSRTGDRRDFLRIMNRPCRYIQRCALDAGDCSEQALMGFYRQKPYMQENLVHFFADLKRIAKLRPYLAIDYIRRKIGYDAYLCEGKSLQERQKLLETADEIQYTASKSRTLGEWLHDIDVYSERLEENAKEKKGTGKGVQLVTMHGSKGLEYDTVFLPYVSAKLIPNSRAHTEAELEEERRIFYVAMTRAKYRLEISYHKEPSPFLAKWMDAPYVVKEVWQPEKRSANIWK